MPRPRSTKDVLIVNATPIDLDENLLVEMESTEAIADADVVVTKDGWLIKNRQGTADRFVTAGERREFGL